MPEYDRSHSMLQLTSPFGPDVLIPTSLSGFETISQPFSYRVQMVSTEGSLDPVVALHQPACVTLRRDEDAARYFHGIFQEFAAAGQTRPGMYAYTAVLVPKFWFLSQTIDCRVFQDKTVVDILTQMLHDAGVTAFDFRLHNRPPIRHYTVQFNETDFHFATRLMEENGLFYFFEHGEDRHTLVITDSNDAFRPIPNATLRFNANVRAEDVLTAWHHPQGTTHGQATLKDYDPVKPGARLQSTSNSQRATQGAKQRDVFIWPAATHHMDVVADRTRLMMEAADASVAVASGSSSFRALAAGGRFSLQGEGAHGATGGEYVTRWMSFEAVDESWSTDGAPAFYANSFEAFPVGVAWRQPFSVARPDMGGVHAAVVLGPQGEEIYTDDHGRVKVQFFWDYRQEANAAQSVWARVVQPWAGNGLGGQFIPRVGTEVAVAFVDGNVDRPVVLGGLYNGNQPPIYSAKEKTKSGFRTRSTLHGGTSDFNELTFDDDKGHELVFLQAQKNLSTKVKDCQDLSVGHDRTVDVGRAERITVGKGRTTRIRERDDKLTVDGGDLEVTVSHGKVTITAMQSIELRVGGSSILIDNGGVHIKGQSVRVEGGGVATVSAPIVQVKGGAETTIQGGIVKVN